MKRTTTIAAGIIALVLALALPVAAFAQSNSSAGVSSTAATAQSTSAMPSTYSKPKSGMKVAVIMKKASIYAENSFDSKVLKTLTFNKKPTLLGIGKTWYYVKSGSVKGFMKKTSLVYYNSKKKHIALTFDDGPSSSTTKIVLNALDKYNCKATFFVLGTNINSKTGKLLKRAVKLGCEIGNHSYSHPQLTTMSKASIKSQISRTDSKIKKYTGSVARLCRTPYGATNKSVLSAVNKPVILWSVDTLDWKYRDTTRLKNYVPSHASDGAIILMHDIHATTAKAVAYICKSLKKKNYEMVTVTELAAINGRHHNTGYYYTSFKKK